MLSSSPATGRRAIPLALLLLAYLGFISLGLPDALLGVAWPSIRQGFVLSQSAIAAVLLCGGAGYMLSSFSTGTLIERLGVGRLLALSTLLVTLALIGYANAPIFPLFAASAALAGLGSGAIDAGLNHHAATHFSARHMNWLHACWGVGATLGPLLMTAVLTRGLSWRLGYLAVAGLMAAMTAAFTASHRAWQPERPAEAAPRETVTIAGAIRHPLVWLHLLLFVLYTGSEASAGAWAFTLLSEGRGLSVERAGLLTSLYWGSLSLGRIAFGLIIERLGTVRTLRLSLLGALAGATLLLVAPGAALSAAGLMLLGLSLAPIFPGMMSETPRRLGAAVAAQAVGFQVSAAVIGSALMPSLIGLLVARTGSLQAIPALIAAGTLGLLLCHEAILRRVGPA